MEILSLETGKPYLFFTVTYFFVGRVERITPTDIVLSDAWLVYNVPDVGKLVAAKSSKAAREMLAVDPPPSYVGAFVLRSVIGAAPIAHLPTADR